MGGGVEGGVGGRVEGGGAWLRGKGREGRVLGGVNSCHTHHPSLPNTASINTVAMDTNTITVDNICIGAYPRGNGGGCGGWERSEREGTRFGGLDIGCRDDVTVHKVASVVGCVWRVRGEGGGVGGGDVGGEGVVGGLGEGWGVPHQFVAIPRIKLGDRRGQNEPPAVPSGCGSTPHGDGGGHVWGDVGEDGREGERRVLLAL